MLTRRRILPLDFPRRHLAQRLHFHPIDHRGEDPLLGPEPGSDGDPDQLSFLILVALVSQTDRERLRTIAKRLGEDM